MRWGSEGFHSLSKYIALPREDWNPELAGAPYKMQWESGKEIAFLTGRRGSALDCSGPHFLQACAEGVGPDCVHKLHLLDWDKRVLNYSLDSQEAWRRREAEPKSWRVPWTALGKPGQILPAPIPLSRALQTPPHWLQLAFSPPQTRGFA